MSSAVPLPGPGWVLVEESLYCTTLQEFLGPLRFVTAEEKRVERIDQWQCGGRERGQEPGRPEKIKRIFLKKKSIEPLEHTCVLLCIVAIERHAAAGLQFKLEECRYV